MVVPYGVGLVLVVLFGGGWLVVHVCGLAVGLALLGAVLYRLRWHELALPWMLGRFLTYKTGVRVTVESVTLRSLQSHDRRHAVVMAEHIEVVHLTSQPQLPTVHPSPVC